MLANNQPIDAYLFRFKPHDWTAACELTSAQGLHFTGSKISLSVDFGEGESMHKILYKCQIKVTLHRLIFVLFLSSCILDVLVDTVMTTLELVHKCADKFCM